MDDIVSLGQSRGARRWPRRLAMIVVVAVIVTTVVQHLPSSQAPAHHRPDVLALGRPDVRAVGPVQLAGLGDGAAKLLFDAGQDHRALIAERALKAVHTRHQRRHLLTPW